MTNKHGLVVTVLNLFSFTRGVIIEQLKQYFSVRVKPSSFSHIFCSINNFFPSCTRDFWDEKKYKPQLFNHNEAGKVGFFNVKRVLWFLEALVLQELFSLRKFKDKGRSVKGVSLSPGEKFTISSQHSRNRPCHGFRRHFDE